MRADNPPNFVRLANGVLLQRDADGSYKPTRPLTDLAALDALAEEEIEQMASNDPDHPALDDAFWAAVDGQTVARATTPVELDDDILAYFRDQGVGYQARINDVLRRYVDAEQKPRC